MTPKANSPVSGKSQRSSPDNPDVPALPAWFCLRTQPKHEHIVAAHLRRDMDIEVCLPRIRFRRATRKGRVWVTEALFPNYLFARFDWHTSLRRVLHARGVHTVVHFGNRWPTVSEEAIAEMRRLASDKEIHTIPDTFEKGQAVEIVGGPFHGLAAVVTQSMPSRQRVAVLLDFLGRQTSVEVSLENVQSKINPRGRI